MSNQLLPYIHPNAKIGKDVVISPFSYIYGDVEIGDGTWIGPNVTIMEGTRKGMAKNGRAQNGAAFMTLRTGVPVIPVNISGEMKLFHKVTIYYGKPLDFSEYKTNKPEKEVLEKVSKEIMDNIIMLTNKNQ